MKEATGELSTTAIAIVAIAAILAIFTTLLLPMLRRQIALTQACNSGPGYNDGKNICCTTPNGANTCTTSGASKVCSTNSVGTGTKQTYTCYYTETD